MIHVSPLVTLMVFSFDSLACDTTSLCDLEQGGTVSRADIQYHIYSETFHLELSEILNTEESLPFGGLFRRWSQD